MQANKLYKKLPKKIRNSEKCVYIMIRFYKFLKKLKRNDMETNNLLTFLFTSTEIKVKGTNRNIQLLYLELLRFIDNVCEKYDLEYCLSHGTLLGAYRHSGFIPWDDDCDIIMMRNDYNKLIEVLPIEINKFKILKDKCGLTRLINSEDNYFKDLNSVYDLNHDKYFIDSNLGKSIFLQFGWLKPFVKLDIFPYDYLKEESIDYYQKHYLATKYYFRMLYDTENFSFDYEFEKRFKKLGYTLNETKFIGEGIDSSYFDDFGVIKYENIFPLKKINFEDYEFKCPNETEKMLQLWYGDNYDKIPLDIWLHDYSKYNLSLFNSKSELNESLKESIMYLKEINDNYK